MFIKCILLLFVLSFVESVPSCSIPRIKNGRVQARYRWDFLRFSCSDQYTLVGNTYAMCRSGQWNVPIPVCVKTGCQPLEEVKNAVNSTSYDNAWVVFFCLPGLQLVGSPVLYCNGTQWNSTTPKCYESFAEKTETECNFEQSNICGWKPDVYHDFDWTRLNKKTYSRTRPQYDHTYGMDGSGYFMYIEDSGSKIVNNTARLMSPVYEAELAKDGCFIFWYHMFGWNVGGLVAYQKPAKLSMIQLQELLLQNNAQNYTLFKQWGDQGNEWHEAIAMLSDFGDNFHIVIEGIRGERFYRNIAIDDVSIQHGENCTRAMAQVTTTPSVLRSTTEDYSSSDTLVIPPQTEELVTTTAEAFAPTSSSTTIASTEIPTIPVSREPATTTTTTTATEKPANTTTATEKPANTTTATENPENTTTATEKPATTVTATEKPATTTSTTEMPATTTTTKMPATNKSPTSPATSTTNTTTTPRPVTPRKTIPTNSTSKIVTIDVSLMTYSTVSVVRTTMDNAGVKTEDVCTCDFRDSGKG